MKKLVVIGAGYVGLVTAVCFAVKGHHVIVVERNLSRIAFLQLGQAPFYEPGLEQLLRQALGMGTITFIPDLSQALETEPDVVFCCVGTPSQRDGIVDLTDVWSVVVEVARNAKGRMLFVQKSTVPVGTSRKTEEMFTNIFKNCGHAFDFDIASNPEFLREGNAIFDFMNPDRVVFGVRSPWAERLLIELYAPFVRDPAAQLLSMSLESSEMTKYVANTMLAARISFMNQMALLADRVGADINDVERGVGSDERIGKHFLKAGLGYGGSCFPKDIKGLIHLGRLHDVEMSFANCVEKINDEQIKAFLGRIYLHYDTSLINKKVGVWGVSFKPETDDIRCSPAIEVLKALEDKVQELVVYDPVALEQLKQSYPQMRVTYAQSASEVLRKVDCLVVCTDWHAFAAYTPQELSSVTDRVVFDGRNIFDPHAMAAAGISYYPVGRCVTSVRDSVMIARGIRLDY